MGECDALKKRREEKNSPATRELKKQEFKRERMFKSSSVQELESAKAQASSREDSLAA
jgi:hypothetical protein